MHADEHLSNPSVVRRLIADRFPAWAALPLQLVDSYGTDHDVYRLGDGLAVRLPRVAGATAQAAAEATWLPVLAPHLPLRVPRQVGVGPPAHGYPYPWSVYEWLPGRSAEGGLPPSGPADLAGFVMALRAVPAGDDVPDGARGGRLAGRDEQVRRCIDELGDRVDGAALRRSWQESLDAWPHAGRRVWLHGDLLPGNVLVDGARVSAVIDWGTLGAGDPAADLLPAWNLFAGPAAREFLDGTGTDEASRLRGRGWALCQAVVALPYYWDTNPRMAAQARRALAAVLADVRR